MQADPQTDQHRRPLSKVGTTKSGINPRVSYVQSSPNPNLLRLGSLQISSTIFTPATAVLCPRTFETKVLRCLADSEKSNDASSLSVKYHSPGLTIPKFLFVNNYQFYCYNYVFFCSGFLHQICL